MCVCVCVCIHIAKQPQSISSPGWDVLLRTPASEFPAPTHHRSHLHDGSPHSVGEMERIGSYIKE